MIRLTLLVTLCISIAGPSYSKKCRKVNENALLAIMDMSRDMDRKKSDSILFKDLAFIHARILSKPIYLLSFSGLNTSRMDADAVCKKLTFTHTAKITKKIETLYANIPITQRSTSFGYATKLDQLFRTMLLSLGALEVSSDGEKIVLIFDNLDYFFTNAKDGRSSEGSYLSDGWLSAPFSPFVKNVLSVDTDRFNDAKVFVFTDGTQPLSVRMGKRRFFTLFFSMLGGNLYYYGPTYSPTNQTSSLIQKIFTHAINGQTDPYTVDTIGQARLLQLINRQKSENISPSDFH